MPITSNVNRLMRKKKVTYEALQEACKIAPDTVARARDERIANCKLSTLAKIAAALNVHLNDLYTYKP